MTSAKLSVLRWARALALVTLAGLALSACGGGSGTKTIALAQHDNGRTVAVGAGDTLRITLPENRTTPYLWRFSVRPSPEILQLTGSKYVPNPAPPKLVGSGGQQTFTFKVLKGGTTSLKLALTYIAKPHTVAQTFAVGIRPG